MPALFLVNAGAGSYTGNYFEGRTKVSIFVLKKRCAHRNHMRKNLCRNGE